MCSQQSMETYSQQSIEMGFRQRDPGFENSGIVLDSLNSFYEHKNDAKYSSTNSLSRSGDKIMLTAPTFTVPSSN